MEIQPLHRKKNSSSKRKLDQGTILENQIFLRKRKKETQTKIKIKPIKSSTKVTIFSLNDKGKFVHTSQSTRFVPKKVQNKLKQLTKMKEKKISNR